MDYSLVVGVDSENKELVVGVVDYIRPFTWYVIFDVFEYYPLTMTVQGQETRILGERSGWSSSRRTHNCDAKAMYVSYARASWTFDVDVRHSRQSPISDRHGQVLSICARQMVRKRFSSTE